MLVRRGRNLKASLAEHAENDKIFCIRDERTPRNDFTIAYNGKLYQIKDAVKPKRSPWKNEWMDLRT
jgi:hypothetical protein